MLKNVIFSLAIGWTILVAFLCLVSFNKLPSFGISGTDKYVHFTFHFIFVLLWGCYSFIKQKGILLNKIALIFFISLCYGLLIEFLQEEATTTRHGDGLDVLANAAGATSALIVFVLINEKTKKSKQALK